MSEFKYNIVTFHLPEGEKRLVLELGQAYNEGWKPTGNPLLVQTSFPGKSGGDVNVTVVYTLAKEVENEAHSH